MAQKAFKLSDLPIEIQTAVMQNPGWIPVVTPQGAVVGMQNPKFGRTEMLVMCEVDTNGVPIKNLYTLMGRENGAIDEQTGFGTPSVFMTPVRLDKKKDLLIGTIEEFRPMIRARYLLRRDGLYLDHLGVLQMHNHLPGDVIQDLQTPVRDHGGELVDRILYRWGVTVAFGIPGGYGAKNLSDLESAGLEVREESGITTPPTITFQSSMDRAWASVMDLYGFVLIKDESEIGEAQLGEHEEIISKLTWSYPDMVDWRLSPDNYVQVAVFQTLNRFGLIGRTPTIKPWNLNDFWWQYARK